MTSLYHSFSSLIGASSILGRRRRQFASVGSMTSGVSAMSQPAVPNTAMQFPASLSEPGRDSEGFSGFPDVRLRPLGPITGSLVETAALLVWSCTERGSSIYSVAIYIYIYIHIYIYIYRARFLKIGCAGRLPG